MSQMKAYCFKCGAELDPEAIVCPSCGRLQRSMVVRSVEPEPGGPAAAPEDRPLYGPPQAPPPDGSRRSPARLLAIVGASILGLFLIGLALGHACTGPTRSTAVVGPIVSVAPTQPSSGTTPSSTPSSRSSAEPGAATWARVSSDIPGGHCTTAQGCPVTGTFKNNGGRGGGTATFSLLDSGGNVVGTYTAQLPATDGGATADVSGYANGDQLPDYLKSGGLVTLRVDVKP
jgi:hypothetical protein